MRLVQSVVVRVFVAPEENISTIKTVLLSFFQFSFENEKVHLQESSATGFDNKLIKILTVNLVKESMARRFVEALVNRLSVDQRRLLWCQRASRLDDELGFFMRFDKQELLSQGALVLTDGGNCFHVRLGIASYPRSRTIAEAAVGKILKQDTSHSADGANN